MPQVLYEVSPLPVVYVPGGFAVHAPSSVRMQARLE